MAGPGASPPPLEVIERIDEEQSRFFLQTMVACAPVGLAFVNRDLRFVHINDTLAEYNGIPREAHLGHKVQDVVPHLWHSIEQHYHQVMEQGRPVLDLPLSGVTAKEPGVQRSWLASYYPVHDQEGALRGIGMVITEITAQRRADEALQASERRYRSLVEAMTQTVWTLNAQGEVVEPAPRWQEFTGQSHRAYSGLGWLGAIHPEDQPGMMKDWILCLAQHVPYQGELRLRYQAGSYRDVSLRCVPVFQDDGSVREWIGLVEDISPRKRTERALQRVQDALQKSEERYRTFVNQSTEGIWRMELVPPIPVNLPEDEQLEAMFRTAYLAECNSAMARMHGLQAPSSTVGRRLDHFLVRTSLRDTEYLRAFIRSGYRLENSESREFSRDGALKVFLSNLVGVVEGGHLVRAWGTQRDVTEQSLARQELELSQQEAQRSEQLLRTIADALPALVAYVDRNERVLFCNRAHETLFGLKPEQLVGQTLREIFKDNYAKVRDWIRRALSGETVRYETVYKCRDGQAMHVQPTYVPSRDARGEVQGFVAHVPDITDRKQAEAEVEAQRARLHDILINSPASICILSGPRQVFTLTNSIFTKYSGGRNYLGTSLQESAQGAEERSFSEQVRRVYETGEPLSAQEVRSQIRTGNGAMDYRIFNFLLHPLRDAQGQVDSVMSFAVDVTDQVQARRKLEEWAAHLANQEKWLRAVLDFMPVAMLLLTPGSGRVIFANRAAHRMAGGTFPLGVPVSQYDRVYRLVDEQGTLIPNDRVPGVRAARGERVQGASLIWETPAGRHFLLIDSETLPAAHGHPATVLLALQDVSQLKQTQDQLQKAVKLRDEFLTVASHELKTPLTPLQLKLQSLMRDCAADLPPEQLRDKVRKTAETAIQQVHKLVGLISDLLDVSRLAEGRLSLLLEPVDLAAIVRELAERYEPQAQRSQCPLVIQADEAVVGRWDHFRLEQVVENLLSNALKYGPGKPVTLRVETGEGKARLIVSDEGIGIPPESLSLIFEKFERAVSPRNYGGLGLGLYITRQIIHSLGGTIRVESQPEQGATFTVELPFSGDGAPEKPAGNAPSLGGRA